MDTIQKPPVISPPAESPPSLNSSPSHEFSFTISLSSASAASLKLSKPPHHFPDDFDLAPADDLFFHGHLLPLHFLSHRPSNASIETDHKLCNSMDNKITPKTPFQTPHFSPNEEILKKRLKATPFSSFFNRKWRRGGENRDEEKQSMKKKKTIFGRLWRKYASFIEPIWFFKSVKEKREFRRSSCSFSGGGNPREGGWRRRWRGDFSAPASMRTSPANSGLLVAPTTALCSSDESTMEELQNAIQAAIAHCKSSGAVKEEKGGS